MGGGRRRGGGRQEEGRMDVSGGEDWGRRRGEGKQDEWRREASINPPKRKLSLCENKIQNGPLSPFPVALPKPDFLPFQLQRSNPHEFDNLVTFNEEKHEYAVKYINSTSFITENNQIVQV